MTQEINSFGPPEHYVAHRAPMLLLDRVLAADEESARCEVHIHPGSPFADERGVPMWVGIEYMAQSIAVFAGIQAEKAGEPIKPGFLLGTRRLESEVPYFGFGEALVVEVRQALSQEDGLSVFSCTVTASQGAQRAQLTVFQPRDAKAYLAGEQA
ncbi:3-hydroxylacyl-ACP dehydratase [Gallaecimonas kandeliae]|uniref:ApeP family dehydratase n=1 Tax=Gallaecimonas kandeliae TaxID=3029055 RepID=UPI0026485165|nr:3-hydroxylacyl-ACP dehydratase [Gallaecimonas kandeliae]WKE63989.1 3-hydroxylacyl-ACP dehydratase [Gallaecimonas kandeliae]